MKNWEKPGKYPYFFLSGMSIASAYLFQEKLFPNGWYGFGLACVVLSFSTGGAQYISELGGEMKTPQKALPRAIIYSTALAAVFFALVSIVAVGILPVEQTAGKPLSEVAKVILGYDKPFVD